MNDLCPPVYQVKLQKSKNHWLNGNFNYFIM